MNTYEDCSKILKKILDKTTNQDERSALVIAMGALIAVTPTKSSRNSGQFGGNYSQER